MKTLRRPPRRATSILVWLRFGHIDLNCLLKKIKTFGSALCPKGKLPERVPHYLLHCQRFPSSAQDSQTEGRQGSQPCVSAPQQSQGHQSNSPSYWCYTRLLGLLGLRRKETKTHLNPNSPFVAIMMRLVQVHEPCRLRWPIAFAGGPYPEHSMLVRSSSSHSSWSLTDSHLITALWI